MSFGQELNKTNDGYTQVVQVELAKKEVHQKLNEWIGINFASANDVIQLNTEDKIIAKGNFSVNFRVEDYSFKYRVHNTLTLSIREGRYKIDMIPTKVTMDGREVDISMIKQHITAESYSKEAYLEYSLEASKSTYLSMGYTEKKAQKMVDKYVPKFADKTYELYLINKSLWDKQINSIFQSIINYVESSNSDDDW
jgi:hypothetical protein